MWTLIRLLKEQSDLVQHCLLQKRFKGTSKRPKQTKFYKQNTLCLFLGIDQFCAWWVYIVYSFVVLCPGAPAKGSTCSGSDLRCHRRRDNGDRLVELRIELGTGYMANGLSTTTHRLFSRRHFVAISNTLIRC